MEESSRQQELLSLTTELVAAFVGNHTIGVGDIPHLISGVFGALSTAGQPEEKPAAAPVPAVPIKKSVTPNYLVCLEDGVKLKMLKRYLATRYNLTPDEYRRRWGLPKDYPMVAPAYAAMRSEVAKRTGLGRKAAPPPPPAKETPTPKSQLRRGGGRRRMA
jgi:predicted transcriptional regulator